MLRRVIVLAREAELRGGALAAALSSCAAETSYAHSVAALVDLIDRAPYDCVVLPVGNDPAADSIEAVKQIRQSDRLCAVLLFDRLVSTESAIRALRAGASDLLGCDASQQEIASTLQALCGRTVSPFTGSAPIRPLFDRERMVGSGPAMEEVRDQIAKVAATDGNVLITGETGTGKELVAELIHGNSRRRLKRFVSVNCAAIPDSLLESELFGYEQGAFTGAHASRDGKLQHASGGTLFLDEVGDMTLSSQAKVLRAIETRVVQKLGSNSSTPIQVRLIAATNQDLEQLTSEKRFRRDLYFRLNVVRIHLPPLRERQEDIPELAEHILRDLVSEHQTPGRRIHGDVLHRLQMYPWPGNIRELRNVIESMVVFSSCHNITIADLPRYMRDQVRSSAQHSEKERSKILTALCSVDWSRAEAAKLLHCSRMTLYRKMVKYSISSKA